MAIEDDISLLASVPTLNVTVNFEPQQAIHGGVGVTSLSLEQRLFVWCVRTGPGADAQ